MYFHKLHIIYIFIFLLSLAVNSTVYAERYLEISGRVMDAKSGNPLSFVHVLDPVKRHGTTTNLEGYFSLKLTEVPEKLSFIYMGYETYELELKDKAVSELKNLRIFMQDTYIELNSFEVYPGDNYALPIIRKTIENRDRHNPNKLQEFTYDTYNRFMLTTDIATGEYPELDFEITDTTNQNLFNLLSNHHFFVMESVVNRSFKYPAHNEERVLAVRASGFKEPHFLELAHSLQVFNFYEEFVRIGINNYSNPISKDALNRYFYNLEDTTFYKGDTVWVISYEPKNQSFYGLKGTLFIHSIDYALEKVLAKTTDLSTNISDIRQQYQRSIDGIWFPDELYIQYSLDFINFNFSNSDVKITPKAMGIGYSRISNLNLKPKTGKIKMSQYGFYVPDEAYKRDESWWLNYRDSMDTITLNTYNFIDSIGEKYNFDKFVNGGTSLLINGLLPWGPVSIDLTKILRINYFEGVRPGIGLETNNKVSRNFNTGAYFAYGFKDEKFKYGGHFNLRLHNYSDTWLKIKYLKDVKQDGRELFLSNNKSSVIDNFLFNTLGKLAEDYEQYRISLVSRNFRYFRVEAFGSWHERLARWDYRFITKDGEVISVYRHAEVGFRLRYAFGEDLIRSGDMFFIRPSSFPVLQINYQHGLSGIAGSHIDYNRLSFRLSQKFNFLSAGHTKYRLTLGIVDRAVPFGLLFTGNGSLIEADTMFGYFVEGIFQTQGANEFAMDRYIELFAEQILGNRIWKAGHIEPRFVIESRAAFGLWKFADRHENIDSRSMSDGFFESGLRIEKLLGNFGLGIFYRYGPYAFDDWSDNLKFKLVLSVEIEWF